MPKISIIVPIYNVEKYLAKCLDSLINQTFSDIEIICINDGSPDNSLQIAELYAKKDKRIILKSQPNQGLSGARNTGLDLASSPYVMFCDSDDYYEPNMCELMFKAIDENNVDMAICGVNVDYLTNVKIAGNDTDYFTTKYIGSHEFSKVNVLDINCTVWNKIFRKSVLDKYKLKFPLGLWYEDNGFFYLFSSVANNFYGISEKLYNYQRVDGSITIQTEVKTTLKILDYISLMEYMYAFYNKHHLLDKYKKFYWLLFINFFNKAEKYLATDNKQHLAYAKANKFLSSLPESDFKAIPKSLLNQIKAIKNGKDPMLNDIKIFTIAGIEICKIITSTKRKRFYIFKIKILSLKLN